ncbi:MAG: hypothetical protein ACYCX6_01570 [Vulcanimicrobiaceae bacterium]
MTLNDVYAGIEAEFRKSRPRKFLPGLVISFIDFVGNLGIAGTFANLSDFYAAFPRQTETSQQQTANTLIVRRDDKNVSLRPFYNKFERFMRYDEQRLDYPSCAPHATQVWIDYQDWFEVILAASSADLGTFRQKTIDFALDHFPSQAFDPNSIVRESLLFSRLLQDFDFFAKTGEPTGAAYQGAVFALIRADAPHLQVEVDKVRTGSKRVRRVGDVDAWDGDRLIITAEVKHFNFNLEDVGEISGFLDQVRRRGALGIVAALEFTDEAREHLETEGVKPKSLEDMIEIVSLWDHVKQRAAISAFRYYVMHKEANSALAERVSGFLESLTKNMDEESAP